MQRRQLLTTLLASAAALPWRAHAAAPAPRVRPDLYACDGCEALAEQDAAALSPEARLPAAVGEPLRLHGRVVHSDGVTPAAGVVLYAHHTNAAGLYADGDADSPWSRRHGRLRGWVRTGADGRYAFHSIKPAPYPAPTSPRTSTCWSASRGGPPITSTTWCSPANSRSMRATWRGRKGAAAAAW